MKDDAKVAPLMHMKFGLYERLKGISHDPSFRD